MTSLAKLFVCAASLSIGVWGVAAAAATTPAKAPAVLSPAARPAQPTAVAAVARAQISTLPAQAKPVHKVQLGGTVEFGKKKFAVEGDPRDPIRFVPFTPADILAVAPKDKVRGSGNDALVRVKNQSGTRWVPIIAYVRSLNAYEAFVNGYGYTLRDGPLAAPGRASEIRPDHILRETGLRFQLLPADNKGQHYGTYVDTNKPIRNFSLFFVPEEMVTGDPTRDPTRGVRQDYGYAILQAPLSKSFISPFAGKGYVHGVSTPAKTATQAGGAKAPAPAPAPPSGPAPGGSDACAAECKLAYTTDYTLSPLGQQIYDNAYLYSRWRCYINTQGTNIQATSNPCTDGDGNPDGKAIETQVHALDIYGSMFSFESYDKWKAEYQDICALKAKMSKSTFEMFYSKVSALAGQETSDGVAQITTGAIPDNFYDGTLGLTINKIADCMGAASDNGWFSAGLCANYNSSNTYSSKGGFAVDNTAGIDSEVTIFGLNFVLLNGEAGIHWHQIAGGDYKQAKKETPSVTEATEDSTLDPKNTSTTYDGPSAVIPIGPIPLTIRSSLTTEITIGAPGYVSKTPAYYYPVKGQDILGVDFGASAGTHVTFDAGIDAVIAFAGIEGQLDLVKASATGGITTTIDTGANDAEVRKQYTLSGNVLSGKVSAFVEIDLLVYSKRWDVDLASFNGFDKSAKPQDLVFKAKAVVPQGAATNCQP